MIKTIVFVACVSLILASPRSLKVEEDLHQIAKEVKSSEKYSVDEKREILANLKEMNKDVKEYDSASASEKKFLKQELKEKMAKLKEEMPDSELVSSQHHSLTSTSSKHNQFEEEEEEVQKRVERIHSGIKDLKEEIKTKSLSSSDKIAAKSLVNELESQYSELADASTKTERKAIARRMKETLAKVRGHMENEKTHSSTHSFETKKTETKHESKEAKKEHIMKLVKQTELEYQEKSLPSTISHKIHAQFEQMKDDLKHTSNTSQLKSKLQASLNKIKSLESSAKDFEEEEKKDNDFEEEEEEVKETKKVSEDSE